MFYDRKITFFITFLFCSGFIGCLGEEPEPSPGQEEAETEDTTTEPETPPDQDEEDCAKILGLVGNYTLEDAKSAYRPLLAQYHPDKVALMGDEIREVAERKAKEINEAYEHFRRKYDL